MGKKQIEKATYEVIGWVSFWDNYESCYAESYSEYKEQRSAVIDELRKNDYVFSYGAHNRHKGCVPLLNNGKAFREDWKRWSEIMSEAHSGVDYDYVEYGTNDSIKKLHHREIKYPYYGVDLSRLVPNGTVFEYPALVENTVAEEILSIERSKLIEILEGFYKRCNVPEMIGNLADDLFDKLKGDNGLAEVPDTIVAFERELVIKEDGSMAMAVFSEIVNCMEVCERSAKQIYNCFMDKYDLLCLVEAIMKKHLCYIRGDDIDRFFEKVKGIYGEHYFRIWGIE